MQPHNTKPLGEKTVKHEQSGGKSLKRKNNGLCTRRFCRPKDEGDVPDAFWANVIATATYVRRKTLLVLAILYILMRTISMFPMPIYPALNQPDCEAQLEFEFRHNWTRPVNHVWK